MILRVLLWPWLAVLLGLGLLGQAQAQPAAQERAREIVLLTTYVVSPARVNRLIEGARSAGVSLRTVSAEADGPEVLQRALEPAALLVIDAPHRSVLMQVAGRFGDTVQQSGRPYVVVGEFNGVTRGQAEAEAPLRAEAGVSAAWAQRLREYWRFGGTRNLQLAMAALRADATVWREAEVRLPPAEALPLAGLYHPAWPRIESDIRVLERVAGGGTVAIAVNSAVFTADDTAWLDTLIATLNRRGLRAYAFYGPRQQKDLYFQMTHLPGAQGPRRVADVIINAALVFNPTDRKAELERIGVPVLQTMPALAMTREEWAQSRDGLALSDVAHYYTTSELAGMVDPVLVTARDRATGSMQPIAAQIDAVADKAAALIRLQRTRPAERHIAMVVYNYPLGERNFGASFLNVPRSLQRMLGAMKDAGYQTAVPSADAMTEQVQATLGAFYRPEALADLPSQGYADVLPLSRYLAWFRALPAETQRRIEDYWGPPAQSLMVRAAQVRAGDGRLEPGFIIPRLQLGNVVVLPQPLRHEVTAHTPAELRRQRIGHRSTVPLSHNYLATYVWMRQQFGAHAVVHLGTHGTLEWAPGKARGLSRFDDPLLALGDLPNVYPYIMDNLGEALTAKRRGRAVMVSHATPMFTPAGFRPGVQEMHDLMHDWEGVAPGPVRQEVEARLLAEFVRHNFHRDLGWSQDRIRNDFSGFMEQLHPYLDEIAQTAQPQGLAVFGEVPDAQRRFGMVMQMLRKPLIDALGEDIDEVFLLDAKKVMQSRPARWLQVALRDPQAASTLDLRAVDAAEAARNGTHSAVPNRAAAKVLDPAVLLALAQRAQQLDALLSRNEELEGLLAALDGRHLATRYGGDPVRNPDSLPTGRNLYGFDPSRVPTREAWETGVTAFEAWMRQYRDEHGGRWPEKLAFNLWAGETMRHQGVMEAQALYALGVRPVWDGAGRVAGLEVMTPEELKRPRIDILLSVTGSYRDQFPLVMRWMDEAVRHAARSGERGNVVARNTEKLARDFRAQGASAEQARRWAEARVFSNEQGAYGTGLSEAVQATDTWRKAGAGGGDAQMAELYLARMGHAQGDGLEAGGAAHLRVYARNLAQVDAALLSRTSHTYGMLTSDDAFQYLGGMAQAMRRLTGKDLALYVQNLRDDSEVRTESAASGIAKEMQTRYLHPQWISAQQAEGYSGTLQVLKTAQFLWGWQVTSPGAVRQDHWQALHDVYVRDQYRLGTRAWLEGSNQAAFAQTLERMLDAVRLKYWQPDAATRRELAQVYREALKATGLRESNAQVRRFAAELLPDRAPASASSANPVEANAAATSLTPAPVRGIRLEPQTVTKTPSPVVNTLATLWLTVLCLAWGGWRQWRRLPSLSSGVGA